MKRQSGNDGKCDEVNKKVSRKKSKGVAASDTKQVAVEKAEEEERKEVEEEWWSGVYEEMPWATSWIPFWEVEAYDALYGDVLWDFDIWDFNGLPLNPS
ncbi:uncharacterized protein LOC125203234 [Salvia hispanica]|uniref:uncharacterized protein LOC125203234 n=1 Tax=Salvia hispanica TaxID=49212 RepID=UPI002009A851|nr:uncharacterized protein LOC125203234 [Salvia hispanica]